MNAGRSKRGPGRSRAIQFVLKPYRERLCRAFVGPPDARGGHHAGAQLPYYLLPCLGVFTDMRHVQLVQHETGRLGSFIVAAETILTEESVWGGTCRV